jgi:hypothetical protein
MLPPCLLARALSLCGALDISITAHVQRGSSETARCTSTGDPLARPLCPVQAHSLISSKGSLVDPLVRASNEHILIVRVPRAGGRPGCPSPLSCLFCSYGKFTENLL